MTPPGKRGGLAVPADYPQVLAQIKQQVRGTRQRALPLAQGT